MTGKLPHGIPTRFQVNMLGFSSHPCAKRDSESMMQWYGPITRCMSKSGKSMKIIPCLHVFAVISRILLRSQTSSFPKKTPSQKNRKIGRHDGSFRLRAVGSALSKVRRVGPIHDLLQGSGGLIVVGKAPGRNKKHYRKFGQASSTVRVLWFGK